MGLQVPVFNRFGSRAFFWLPLTSWPRFYLFVSVPTISNPYPYYRLRLVKKT